jgi:protein-S-isoprenylcysteine O-methyltransferase Ste14
MNREANLGINTDDEQLLKQGTHSALRATASAAMVNRTHRVIRERAKTMQARRSKMRSLWIPLAVSGSLLAVLVSAIWSLLDQYELSPTGLPDANQQMLVLMMWCLPVSALLLVVVWLRRGKADNGSAR